MNAALLIAIAGVAALVAALFYLQRQLQQVKNEFRQQSQMLQQTFSQRFDSNINTVSNHLGIITGQITNTSNVITQVEGKLGQMQEAGRQIYDLAKQISSLRDILQSPKMRGNLGEFMLSELLSRCMDARAFKL